MLDFSPEAPAGADAGTAGGATAAVNEGAENEGAETGPAGGAPVDLADGGEIGEIRAASGAAVELDGAQRRAVDHGEGPCLVLAGPGSGKTRVIVERFLRLIREGTPAERLLVLTYTRKAATEMRDRVERAHGPFEGDPPLLNYHSFAQRVLRHWGWRLGISPAFRIADEAERNDAEDEADFAAPAQLGAQRFVYAAYFTGAVAVAFLLSKAISFHSILCELRKYRTAKSSMRASTAAAILITCSTSSP